MRERVPIEPKEKVALRMIIRFYSFLMLFSLSPLVLRLCEFYAVVICWEINSIFPGQRRETETTTKVGFRHYIGFDCLDSRRQCAMEVLLTIPTLHIDFWRRPTNGDYLRGNFRLFDNRSFNDFKLGLEWKEIIWNRCWWSYRVKRAWRVGNAIPTYFYLLFWKHLVAKPYFSS